jgi:hypothetical protein
MDDIITSPNSRGLTGVSLGGGEPRKEKAVLSLASVPAFAQLEWKRISKRRAGATQGNILYIARLRRPNKDGNQTLRDIVKRYKLENEQAAEQMLLLKIAEAKDNPDLALEE